MTTYRVFFDPNPLGVISLDIQGMSTEEVYDALFVLSVDSFRFDLFIDKVVVL